ncbi:MAG TPA: helix-turn-helix transcriptional regulator [Candidatus Obscuribacterales bacterium]
MIYKKRKRRQKFKPWAPGPYIQKLLEQDPKFGTVYEAFVLVATLARQGAGLSRAQLAEKVGTTPRAIAEFEAGNAPPASGAVYQRIKEVLMITFTCDDEPGPDYPCAGIMIDLKPFSSHLN